MGTIADFLVFPLPIVFVGQGDVAVQLGGCRQEGSLWMLARGELHCPAFRNNGASSARMATAPTDR